MSIWADIHRRSNGIQIRKEDEKPIYFRVTERPSFILPHFELGEKMTFNENTDKECIGEYITSLRISSEPIFKMVKGERSFIENGVTISGYNHPFEISFI